MVDRGLASVLGFKLMWHHLNQHQIDIYVIIVAKIQQPRNLAQKARGWPAQISQVALQAASGGFGNYSAKPTHWEALPYGRLSHD